VEALENRLRSHGINPSAQRLAVARYVLSTTDHPSADEVWERARRSLPAISRATVYNTLNLFVHKELIREVILQPGRTRFDANTAPHHHFIDEQTGRIFDVPFDSVEVTRQALDGFDVHAYEVVLRGKRRRRG
jgi:Fur family iron response transcriptional regulator